MKDLLVTWGLLFILMFFPLQFTNDNLNSLRITAFKNIVHSADQKARTDGCFTEDNITDMKQKLCMVFDVSESEITLDLTTTVKYRIDAFDKREMIHYKVGVPIKKVIAMNKFFNISDENNKTTFYDQGDVASEVLP